MSELSKAIVQKVFQSLDIVQVLKYLDYRTDTIQETSKSVRCFCPIHKEQIFRTYTFEPRTGKGRCSYTPCPAHAPHDIIGLTALFHGVDYETATEKLVEHFQLRVAVTEEEAATNPLLAAYHDLENGKAEEAYKSFSAIVEEEPRNIEALQGLVKTCAALGKADERATLQLQLAELFTSKRMWEDAANTYALYLERNSDDIPTRLRYAESLHHLERKTQMVDEMMRIAELFEKREEWEKAFEIYKRVEIFRPGVLETQEAMEELLAKMGRKDEAAEKILKRAEEYRKQDDMDKAMDCYTRVVELDPSRDDMRQLFIEGVLARTKPKREDMKQCLELLEGFSATSGEGELLAGCLERLLDRFPENKSLHEKTLLCAERIETAGFGQRALVIYEKLRACGFRPADLDGAIQRLLVQSGRGEEVIHRLEEQAGEYLAQGKLPEALSCYDQILKLAPERDDIRQKYLDAVLASPEVDEAIVNQCLQMVDTFTTGPTGDDVLGMLAKILQRFRDNAAMLDKALQTGKILESEGDIDKALEVYRLAAEAQPDLEEARLAIEKALIESGRKNEAIENVVMQAESHLRSGQIPEAMGLFAKALDMDPGRDDLRFAFDSGCAGKSGGGRSGTGPESGLARRLQRHGGHGGDDLPDPTARSLSAPRGVVEQGRAGRAHGSTSGRRGARGRNVPIGPLARSGARRCQSGTRGCVAGPGTDRRSGGAYSGAGGPAADRGTTARGADSIRERLGEIPQS
jgi:tetratricopeptide (TPR) repeat protein